MKTTKRILWTALAALTALSTAVVTAAPALAGTRLNHSEPLSGR
jgi:hypothetical protein